MTITVRFTKPDSEWDSLLDQFSDASIYQTSAYGLERWGERSLLNLVAESQDGVVAVHASAVVGDPDEATPAGLDADRDRARSRVETVLDQFLDHGSRALDHLARGDAVDRPIVQDVDAAQGCTLGSGKGSERGMVTPLDATERCHFDMGVTGRCHSGIGRGRSS